MISSTAFARPAKSIHLNSRSELNVHSTAVARVYFSDQEDLNWLASWLDVWEVDHAAGYIVAMLRPSDYQTLLQSGFRIEIDEQKTAELNRRNETIPGQVSGIPGFPCYRTVEETYASLEQLATDYPDLVSVTDIGDSWEKTTPGGLNGYDIYSIVITNQSISGPKPKFFLMAAIHAREYATAELATRFAEHLVANYGVDPDITWLLDYYEIHIVPQANPDGRKIAETGNYWRKNTHVGCFISGYRGVDLNRNSSFKWGYDDSGSSSDACAETYRGLSAASEPETQSIQNYVTSIFPDQRGNDDSDPAPDDTMGTFITLHSYGEWVLFPWGWSEAPSPNDTTLETLGRKYGFFNQYLVCQAGEPGCIYPTNGSTDDWAYGDLGLAAYTFEIGTGFFQSCSYFENTLIQENFPALLFGFKAARLPYQNPAGPETLNLTLDSDSVPSSTPVTLTATANDTRYDSNGWGTEPSQDIQAARYSLDMPSWQSAITFPLDPADGSFDTSIEGLQTILDTTGWAPGKHILFVESQDIAGTWGVPSAVFLTIEGETYAPDLQPPESSQDGSPGDNLNFSLQLTNLGTTVDTFDIQASGNAWETLVPDSPLGPLRPGESLEFTVSVAIPPDALPGMGDQALITATSQGDRTKTATAMLTSTVKPDFAFEIDPNLAEGSGSAGKVVSYILTIANTGALEDSYTTSLGEHSWETLVSVPDSPLPAGESAQINIGVAIPADSAPGTTDQVEITFTSQGDSNLSTVATLITRVDIPIYLPLIKR